MRSDDKLADLFPRPSDATRDHRRDDLLQRARLVRANGWTPYQAVWSTGEVVVGVAALLNDVDSLSAMDETLHKRCHRRCIVRITPSYVRVSTVAARTPITIHAEGRGELPGGAVWCHHTIPNPTTVAVPLM